VCFSAEASFVSSAVLTIGGIATLKQVRETTDLPFACFPLIFALHQFVEGCIWLIQGYSSPPWLEAALASIFPLIAYSLWATLVPYAIYRMENHVVRKKLLKICLVVGIGVSVFFLYYIVKGPVSVKIINNSIQYDFYFSFFVLSQWAYGFAIILAAMISSHKIINLFGLGLVVTYNVGKIFYAATYPSVFCFLAAWLSLIIFLHVKYGRQLQHVVTEKAVGRSYEKTAL